MRAIVVLNRLLFLTLALASVAVVYFSIAILFFSPGKPKVVMCYYSSWAVYRRGNGSFNEEQIDPFLCTHLVYAFAGLDPDTLRVSSLDPHRDLPGAYGSMDGFLRFNRVNKAKNKDLVTLLAVGGWDEGSSKFSQLASSGEESRKEFARKAADFLQKYEFDGMDLDWEFPGDVARGGTNDDAGNFALLLGDLRSEFDLRGHLKLTAAVSASPSLSDRAYKGAFRDMAEKLDLVSVMTYDYHGWFGPDSAKVTGHNAPLYSPPGSLDIDESITYWLRSGIPSNKLLLGVPAYARGFTIQSAKGEEVEMSEIGPGRPVFGPSRPGSSTVTPGLLGINELCEQKSTGKKDWKFHRDFSSHATVATSEPSREWMSIEDAGSVRDKMRYAESRGLAGAMLWTMDTDDFRGDCGEGSFPLLTAISESLNPGLADRKRKRWFRSGEF